MLIDMHPYTHTHTYFSRQSLIIFFYSSFFLLMISYKTKITSAHFFLRTDTVTLLNVQVTITQWAMFRDISSSDDCITLLVRRPKIVQTAYLRVIFQMAQHKYERLLLLWKFSFCLDAFVLLSCYLSINQICSKTSYSSSCEHDEMSQCCSSHNERLWFLFFSVLLLCVCMHVCVQSDHAT